MEASKSDKERSNKRKRTMKKIGMILTLLALSGCASQSATEKLSVTAKNTIDTAIKTLKPECQTAETLALLNSANSTVDSMLVTCEQQVEVLDTKITNRNLIIALESVILALIVALYLRKL